jgi:hypothetical protein
VVHVVQFAILIRRSDVLHPAGSALLLYFLAQADLHLRERLAAIFFGES